MDLLTGNLRKLFFKYLMPAIGSAVVAVIYGCIDTIAMGQGVGPDGTAGCAIFMPVFYTMDFLSVLFGTGGAVLYSKARGEGKKEKSNAFFTATVLFALTLSLLIWICLLLFQEPIYRFFGCDDHLLPFTRDYGLPIILAFPAFIFTGIFGSFVRNDENPNLVVTATVIGAVLNILGDWLFVFPLQMGMLGAGLATAIGGLSQCLILSFHFLRKKNSLRLVKPFRFLPACRKIIVNGFGAGFSNLAVIAIAFIINNQIMKYSGSDALAVYGMIGTISSLFMGIFNGIGQASQPIISSNLGAGQTDRCRHVFRLGMTTACIFGLLSAALCIAIPLPITALFMKMTPGVEAIAPFILSVYALSFFPLGINIFISMYLQSVM